MDEIKRPSWEEYFMEIAFVVSKRSTCLRRKVGAIAVKDRQILATGYNGAPAHVAHCSQVGCVEASSRSRLEKDMSSAGEYTQNRT